MEQKNILPRIISFCGRKQSGKTTLSNVCVEKFGYTLINFADGLKYLICELFDITYEYLNDNKEVIKDYNVNENHIKLLSKRLDISIDKISELIPKKFNSIRHILQFIGTDLIRKYNSNWHIDNIKKQIQPNKRYCFGDTRFLNEKEMIENNGGECWFIIRPNNFNISNHSSEIDILWNHFPKSHIIINNITKKRLEHKWYLYLKNMENITLKSKQFNMNNKLELRNFLIESLNIYNITELSNKYNCSKNKVVWWCNNLFVQIDKDITKYNKMAFLDINSKTSYIGGVLTANGCVKIDNNNVSLNLNMEERILVEKYKEILETDTDIYEMKKKDGVKKVYSMDTNNPYIIENIKLWNIKPQKTMKEEIPDIIINNIKMIKYWIVGLIDGKGDIFMNGKNLKLRIISSLNIINFLKEIIPISMEKKVHRKKNGNGIYELYCDNNVVLDFCDWLGEDVINIGLKLKWDNINKFRSFQKKE